MFKRIDHIIMAVPSVDEAVVSFERLLGLKKFVGHPYPERGFTNAEMLTGNGFLGIVEPLGEKSQLHGFLARKGKGFYACSVEVDDLEAVAKRLDEHGVTYPTWRDPETNRLTLIWGGPKATRGVLFQITLGNAITREARDPKAGGNPHILGVTEMTMATWDAKATASTYVNLFGLAPAGSVDADESGRRGETLAMENGDTIVIAEPASRDSDIGRFLEERGEGIYRYAWLVDDLDAVVSGIEHRGFTVQRLPPAGGYARVRLDPHDTEQGRYELRQRV